MFSPFYKWVGQVVAPDENVDDGGDVASFWSVVAPDPEFDKLVQGSASTSTDATADETTMTTPPSYQGEITTNTSTHETPTGQVVPPSAAFDAQSLRFCLSCNQVTPVRPVRPADPTSTSRTTTTPFTHGTPLATALTSPVAGLMLATGEELEAAVGASRAAKATATTNKLTHLEEFLFRNCASTTKLTDKRLAKIKKVVEADPPLTKSRARNLGLLAPDGSTPLITAAQSGNFPAAKIITEADESAPFDRDLTGATAMHRAAEQGDVAMVTYLKEKHEEKGQDVGTLVDASGQTPYGRFVLSPKPKQRSTQTQLQLQQLLFSPTDRSIRGNPQPPLARQAVVTALQLAYGIADMPGKRVTMEDAICTVTFDKNNGRDHYCLLGVCDGHGDMGKTSQFVSEHVAALLQQQHATEFTTWQQVWNAICLKVDADLKKSGRPGGSTSVFCLVTKDEIVVANVGDSRCILVQKGSGSDEPPELVEETVGTPEKTTTTSGDAPETPTVGVDGTITNAIDQGFVAVAMSDDHKPNLPAERQRIENNNLKVVEATIQEDDGTTSTIYRVQKSENNTLAVSRSFGDFEYKSNNQLGPDEQAVIAVPEVRVHSRDATKDMYLVLACDGVWDVMSNEDVAKFVVDRVDDLDQGADNGARLLSTVGDDLLEHCLNKGSTDNMSVVVAALSQTMDKCMSYPGTVLQFASPEPKR
ncbi:Protein phosphatase 2C [Seminavis robusta]|uniref:Protein phosphatase 2C n=1 Tax=Seminavis robusta TaxID=568900 RepID=A0A9N8F0C6_9STRA|nr:Protein phosphatase 2C [Seminavis robusta]|eukprot:Sro2572_g331620.1 Protein phosphatase 2C (702) ;mRNA; r:4490-6671